jgi:hypothetical protein
VIGAILKGSTTRLCFQIVLIGVLPLASSTIANAQTQDPALSGWSASSGAGNSPDRVFSDGESAVDRQMTVLAQAAVDLRMQQAAVQANDGSGESKKLDLLQKQVETQQKMIELLMRRIKQQPVSTESTQKLELLTETLQSRALQAAQRDDELAHAVDTIIEHQDAQQRYAADLPAQLHELYLPSGNNESPLTIAGALAVGFSKIPGTPGAFYYGEFSPDFFVKVNDWILLEAEIAAGSDGSVGATFLQADFMVNDWLTIIAGEFVAPIGFFNERLNNPWINKLPGDAPGSAPLLWQQVLPAMEMLGVQARGAFYLGNSPIKMEYTAYFGTEGLNVTPATPGMPTSDEVANEENMINPFGVSYDDETFGGRLGLWWPEAGFEVGISAMHNGDYLVGFTGLSMNLWAVDLNYRNGNWDARFEYGTTYQQAPSSVTSAVTGATVAQSNITREGLYAQLAYRPYDARNKYLQRTEFVYRFSWADFRGINPANLAVSDYDTPIDVPVPRYQNEFGINYYFYQRMELKVAYQINTEPGNSLHDNNLMTELAWGW